MDCLCTIHSCKFDESCAFQYLVSWPSNSKMYLDSILDLLLQSHDGKVFIFGENVEIPIHIEIVVMLINNFFFRNDSFINIICR